MSRSKKNWDSLVNKYGNYDLTNLLEQAEGVTFGDLDEAMSRKVSLSGDVMSGGLYIRNELGYAYAIEPFQPHRPAGTTEFTRNGRVIAEQYWDIHEQRLNFNVRDVNGAPQEEDSLEIGRDRIRINAECDLNGDLFVKGDSLTESLEELSSEINYQVGLLEAKIATKYNKTGGDIAGTMSVSPGGDTKLTVNRLGVTLGQDPTQNFHATTKKYVDETIATEIDNIDLSGLLYFKGTRDLTTATPDGDELVGYSYVNTVTGTPDASWNLLGDVTLGDIVTLGDNGWFVIGQVSVPDLSGYATVIDSEAADQLLSDRLDILETDPTTQSQLDTVNQNLSLRIADLELDPVTKAYVDATQADQDVEIEGIKADYVLQSVFDQNATDTLDALDLKADKSFGEFNQAKVYYPPSVNSVYDGSFIINDAAGDSPFQVYTQRKSQSDWEPQYNYVFYNKRADRIRDWLTPAVLNYNTHDGKADTDEVINVDYLRTRVRPYIDAADNTETAARIAADEALKQEVNNLIADLQSSSALVFRGRIDATTEAPDGSLDYGKLSAQIAPGATDGNDAKVKEVLLNSSDSGSITHVILNHDTIDSGRKNWFDIFESGSKMRLSRSSDGQEVTLTVEPGSRGGQGGRGYSFAVTAVEGSVTFAAGDQLTVTLVEREIVVGDVWANTTAGTAVADWGLTEDVNEGDLLAYGGGAWAVVGESVVPDLSHLETIANSEASDAALGVRIDGVESDLTDTDTRLTADLAAEVAAREAAVAAEETARIDGDSKAVSDAIEYVDAVVDRLFVDDGGETAMSDVGGYSATVANFTGGIDALSGQIKFNKSNVGELTAIVINHDSSAGRINWYNVFRKNDIIRLTNETTGQTFDLTVEQGTAAGPSGRAKNFNVIGIDGTGVISDGDSFTIKALPKKVYVGNNMEVSENLEVGGTLTVSGALTAGSLQTGDLTAGSIQGDDLTLTGALNVSGDTTIEGNLDVKGGSQFFHKKSGGVNSELVLGFDEQDTFQIGGTTYPRKPVYLTGGDAGLRIGLVKLGHKINGWQYDFNPSNGSFEPYINDSGADPVQSEIKAPTLGGSSFSWGGLYLAPGRTDQSGSGELFEFTVNESGAVYNGPIDQPTSLVTKEWVELNGGGGGGGGGSAGPLVIVNTNPSSPSVGQQWYNTTDKALYIRVS